MVFDVGKGWHFSIIAHAVNTGLCQLKDDCLLVGIIVGLGDPLGLTISIHRNRIEVAGLLVLCRCVRNGNADSLSIQVAQLGFLAVFDFPQGDVINGAISDSHLCLNRGNGSFLHLQDNVAAGLAVQLLEGIQGEAEIGHPVCIDGEALDIFLHQSIQCIRFQRDLYTVQLLINLHRDFHRNTIFLITMLFRIILCSLDGIRHHGIGNGHIALSVCLDLLTLRRGGDIGFVHIGALDDGGIVVNGTLPIIGR